MNSLIQMLFWAVKPLWNDGGTGSGGTVVVEGGTAGGAAAPAVSSTSGAPASFSWKTQLSSDYANAPSVKQYEDTKDGFNSLMKSHLSLDQMLGKEKVVMPKDDKDVEGWNRLGKALGVPDRAVEYGLQDPELPNEMKGITMDKAKFAEVVHAHKLTPGQAKGLWQAYTEINKDVYQKTMNDHRTKVTDTINRLRGEWGDAYERNVELGQTVINKFAVDKDMNDFMTSTILSDPRGIKFLAKIGNQFAENKIGEFAYKNFSLTPDQAQAEIDTIVRDKQHPYNNDKAPAAERERAISYVNSLYAARSRKG